MAAPRRWPPTSTPSATESACGLTRCSSGHAHLYQRFSRQVNGRTIPYVVSGSGGHLQHAPRAGLPKAPTDFGNYRLEVDPIFELGSLTLTVTMAGRGNPTLTGTFH